MHNMLMKVQNMGNSFDYSRHSSVPGVKWRALTAVQRATSVMEYLCQTRQNDMLSKSSHEINQDCYL